MVCDPRHVLHAIVLVELQDKWLIRTHSGRHHLPLTSVEEQKPKDMNGSTACNG